MDSDPAPNRCTRCGTALPGGELGGLCPTCLFAQAVPCSTLTVPSAATRVGGSSSEGQADLRLAPGQRFGRFRIERLLGRGGMGEVYAAEQTDDGRRVALKVLRERLADPQDRARFLREGQLAASVSHPNCVYVYGSEEIDGVPVITMELLPAGTLKDRVTLNGPLPAVEAVEVMRQVLAGLDAACAAGILHRDVKPSNCFVAGDGTVKIGDFGLSISTLARDVTHSSADAGFRGTPQFASPEQLRGEALDVRTDIYSVGATLYYLLTGSAPFDARDLATLVARVKSEPPRSPRDVDRRIPRRLARIVLQCLDRDPERRPASHSALSIQLRPYNRRPFVRAELGQRFAAGVIDAALMIPVLAAASLIAYLLWGERAGWMWSSPWALVRGTYVLAALLYFAVLEGLWGASFGKRVIGLRVVGAGDNQGIGLRAALRAAVFCLPNVMVLLAARLGAFDDLWAVQAALPAMLYVAVLAALFAGARRQNGFAALHDRISATRVVAQSLSGATQGANSRLRPMTIMPVPGFRRGPFEVRGSIRPTTDGELLEAFDPILRRRVCIHEVPPATPALSPVQRDGSRAGRLHWLAGLRSEVEAWDAYEALDGAPLSDVLMTPVPWSHIKRWLADLSVELEATGQDGQDGLPACAFGRVWITAAGQAKFLDFEIAGASPDQPRGASPLVQAQQFLYSIADAALRGPADLEWRGRLRLPLHARVLLDRLITHDFSAMSEVSTLCRKAATLPDEVTTERRIAHIGLMTMPVACTIVGFALVEPIPTPQLDWNRLDLHYFLHTLKEGYEKPGTRFPTTSGARALIDRSDLDALEVYTLGRFGAVLDSGDLFGNPGSWTATIDRVRGRHPQVTAGELAAASRRLQPFLADREVWNKEVGAAFDARPFEWWQLADALASTLTVSLIPVLLSAVLVPGGLVLAGLGMAVVRRDGSPISRARSFVRVLISWSPVILLVTVETVLPSLFGRDVYWAFYEPLTSTRATALAMLAMFAGGCAAVVTPTRGIQDRLAGTWLVSR